MGVLTWALLLPQGVATPPVRPGGGYCHPDQLAGQILESRQMGVEGKDFSLGVANLFLIAKH